MSREDILRKSRQENKNKDLADLEVSAQAGHIAGRVGAMVCCLLSLLSSVIADEVLLSPWIIYFSILSSHYLVKYLKIKRSTDLYLTIVYFIMCALMLIFFIKRLIEVQG